MKSFQRLFAAAVLTSAFTLVTFAGDMDCGVAPPPPPPNSSQVQIDTDAPRGDIDTGAGATTDEGAWSAVVWGVVEGVLALL